MAEEVFQSLTSSESNTDGVSNLSATSASSASACENERNPVTSAISCESFKPEQTAQLFVPLSTSKPMLNFTDELFVQGNFLKLGSKVKNWKLRRYAVVNRHSDSPTSSSSLSTSSPLLLYYDGAVLKGSMDLQRVQFAEDTSAAARSVLGSSAALLSHGCALVLKAPGSSGERGERERQ